MGPGGGQPGHRRRRGLLHRPAGPAHRGTGAGPATPSPSIPLVLAALVLDLADALTVATLVGLVLAVRRGRWGVGSGAGRAGGADQGVVPAGGGRGGGRGGADAGRRRAPPSRRRIALVAVPAAGAGARGRPTSLAPRHPRLADRGGHRGAVRGLRPGLAAGLVVPSTSGATPSWPRCWWSSAVVVVVRWWRRRSLELWAALPYAVLVPFLSGQVRALEHQQHPGHRPGPDPAGALDVAATARARVRDRSKPAPLLEELAGGVVGQDLAAGLAGGAVVDRVAACTRPRARRRRTPGRPRRCGGAPRRAAPWTSSCRRGRARRPATRRCRRRWRRPGAPTSVGSSLDALANGDSRARWQISLARRRPTPARARWSRSRPCSRIEWAAQIGGQRRRVEVSASGPRPASGSWASRPPSAAVAHPHPGPLLGARLGSSSAEPSANDPAGQAAPGLDRLLLVGLEPAALHEVHDEGDRRRSRAAGTCPGDRRRPAPGRRPARAAARRS